MRRAGAEILPWDPPFPCISVKARPPPSSLCARRLSTSWSLSDILSSATLGLPVRRLRRHWNILVRHPRRPGHLSIRGHRVGGFSSGKGGLALPNFGRAAALRLAPSSSGGFVLRFLVGSYRSFVLGGGRLIYGGYRKAKAPGQGKRPRLLIRLRSADSRGARRLNVVSKSEARMAERLEVEPGRLGPSRASCPSGHLSVRGLRLRTRCETQSDRGGRGPLSGSERGGCFADCVSSDHSLCSWANLKQG